MLNEVRSTVLRQGVIKFREGLNVVLGDDNAANSIGKSTALMIVDFVFGGDSFLYLNRDAIRELGEHSYQFRFDFDGEAYFFSRETITPNFVLRCDSDYRAVEEIDLRTYTEWLKSCYFPAKQGLSFRAFVGTYSRIWPKDNVSNVRHPLHAIPNQGARECISILIKIFDRFAEIESAQAELYRKESERKALTQAVKFSIVEKIGARQYSKNQVGLERILQEVDAIKFDLAKYALNIREVVDKDLLDLKRAKDALLSQLLRIKEKLQRTERNLNDCRYIRSEQFEALRDFFSPRLMPSG
ncbi:hypothetical protein [Burkholderia sp. S171]|uniref:hypothetical protein n=1 Tax=Burkholderia sp. S171 TaxID=1641860 RepID=UPI00131E8035|nr:hypothetical protein [Burkholderia sp. S171]